MMKTLYDSRANARKLTPLENGGGDSMMTVELFFGLIAVASLCLTIYFGMKR